MLVFLFLTLNARGLGTPLLFVCPTVLDLCSCLLLLRSTTRVLALLTILSLLFFSRACRAFNVRTFLLCLFFFSRACRAFNVRTFLLCLFLPAFRVIPVLALLAQIFLVSIFRVFFLTRVSRLLAFLARLFRVFFLTRVFRLLA